MKTFREFVIKTTPANEELISGVLWQLDIQGVTEEGDTVKCYAGPQNAVSYKEIESLLNSLREQNLLDSFELTENPVEDRNWNEEWEKTINVIEVSDRIVIKPSFREYTTDDPGKIILTIDPKMSFGTGEHETTRLMIKMLERHVKPGYTVLDAGTGTGVLAIAAVKLGASEALAFDNDEWCYENGLENSRVNGVSDSVEIRNCEMEDIEVKEFDMVIANINKNILIDIAEGLRIRMKKGGVLILSGLLEGDEDDIVRKFTSLGLKHTDKMQMNEWISLAFADK